MVDGACVTGVAPCGPDLSGYGRAGPDAAKRRDTRGIGYLLPGNAVVVVHGPLPVRAYVNLADSPSVAGRGHRKSVHVSAGREDRTGRGPLRAVPVDETIPAWGPGYAPRIVGGE